MLQRRRYHPARILCVALAVLCVNHRAQGQVASRAIEGKWAGMAGPPNDRVLIGIEFKRDSSGTLKGLYHVYAYDGLPMDGSANITATGVEVPAWGLTLNFRGDSLDGRFFVGPMTLGRAATLPAQAPVPPLPTGPGPRWQNPLGGAIHASVAVRDSVAYVGTTAGMFYAIRLRDGGFVWSFPVGRPVFGAALAVDSAVYVASDNGYLYRLDRNTGKEVWRYDLGDSRASRILTHQVDGPAGDFDFDDRAPTPVIAHGVIFIGSGVGVMHAVDAGTGTRVWASDAKGKIRGSALVDGDRVLFGSLDNFLYALDRSDGHEVWKKDTRGPLMTAPAIVAGRVVIGNRAGLIAGLDPSTGDVAWRVILWGSSAESEAAWAGGSTFLFGSSDLHQMALMDAMDGKVLWRTDVFGWAWPRPTPSDNRVFVSTVGAVNFQFAHLGGLVALDRETGAIVWRWPVASATGGLVHGFLASPVVASDLVIVGGLNGTLYAFPAR